MNACIEIQNLKSAGLYQVNYFFFQTNASSMFHKNLIYSFIYLFYIVYNFLFRVES